VGDVVGLDGTLGAGKTQLVQGILQGLEFDPSLVTSPTFTLIQEYEAKYPVCHLDVYRLRDIDEFLELGVDELLGGPVICLIEWASRVAEVLPRDRLQINLTILDEQQRQIRIGAEGPRSQQRLQEFLQVR
jgi:tRNA threonylcarbamoyladenosine biosynthesis protein TsaE